jgi:RND family efflux transporter MFP subunit
MLRSNRPALALVLLVLAPGCSSEAAAKVEPPAPAIDVEIVQAQVATVPKTVRLTGTLVGEIESNFAANASGRVLEVKVDVGSRVKKGDVLARLDTNAASLVASEASAQAELARSRRESAKRECERAAKLFESGAISKQELDRTKDQCDTSDLDVRAAELRVGQASKTVVDGVVRSSFDGVVTERFVEPGEYVRPDSNVVRVATVDPLRLHIEVPEAFVASAKEGAKVSLSVSAYPGRSWSAAIDRRGVAVRQASRDVVCEASVPNADDALLPGMFATVELTVGEEPLPTVPRKAVTLHAGKARVFVVTGGHANERAVFLGPEIEGERVAVRRGLSPEDQLVAAPPPELENGRAVE